MQCIKGTKTAVVTRRLRPQRLTHSVSHCSLAHQPGPHPTRAYHPIAPYKTFTQQWATTVKMCSGAIKKLFPDPHTSAFEKKTVREECAGTTRRKYAHRRQILRFCHLNDALYGELSCNTKGLRWRCHVPHVPLLYHETRTCSVRAPAEDPKTFFFHYVRSEE